MTSGKLAAKRCSGDRAKASEASKRSVPTMSLHPEQIGEVPEETARIAKACFPKGNRYIRLRDTLGTMFDDHEFVDLFPQRGQPAEAPWRLALVCFVQYMEELTDRQAADAVRSRMDIKYLLGLELTDPGFDFSVLVPRFALAWLSIKRNIVSSSCLWQS